MLVILGMVLYEQHFALEEFSDMSSHHIPKIVITGGPCAGKTSVLAAVTQWCQERGFTPVIIPEAATTLITSGFNPTTPEFQDYIIREILHAEKLREDAAAASQFYKPVFIYDRGLSDARAYMSDEAFESTLTRHGLNRVTARDYYSGVIFLHSAANGAEEHYTLSTNSARKESIEEARVLNTRTLAAWEGTPHLSIIENRSGQSFNDKIQACLGALARILGVPEPLEQERRFLLLDFNSERLPHNAVPIDIVQTYLIGATGQTERVRARGQNNHYFYFHTLKTPVSLGVVNECDAMVDHHEYQNFLVRKDPLRLPVSKTRHCFVHGHHYCELDVFQGHCAGLVILEIEVDDLATEITLPEYLGPYKEITGNSNYSNYALAKPL